MYSTLPVGLFLQPVGDTSTDNKPIFVMTDSFPKAASADAQEHEEFQFDAFENLAEGIETATSAIPSYLAGTEDFNSSPTSVVPSYLAGAEDFNSSASSAAPNALARAGTFDRSRTWVGT